MRLAVQLGPLIVLVAGCVGGPAVPPGAIATVPPQAFENPVLISVANHELVYETVVDVVDDYFRIEEEVPVRLIGNVYTEGRIQTFPEVGSTIFEPWRRDSANNYEKLESTLQTIRRYATVRVFPDAGGFRVEVDVFKELENALHPEAASFINNEGAFRYDTSLTRVVAPVGEQEINHGWIPLGRDPALEQQMIAQILARVGSACQPR